MTDILVPTSQDQQMITHFLFLSDLLSFYVNSLLLARANITVNVCQDS